MDCPDTCSLEVHTSNGSIDKIGGNHLNPVTAGFICSKVANFGKRVFHKDRLLHPLKRKGPKGQGSFEQISWDEAIDTVAGRLKATVDSHGGEAVLPYNYGGSNGFMTDSSIDDYFFARLGASRISKTLCAAPTTAVATAMYGKMAGVSFEDYPLSKFIAIWGANPKASNIHLVPYLKAAKKQGAFIAVIDPRRNFSTGEIDLHLPVVPGTDLILALGIIRYWASNNLLDKTFMQNRATNADPLLRAAEEWTLTRTAEVCGVKSDQIQQFAEKYAELNPAVLRCGWGLERNINGGQAAAAVLAMPALLGKFGVRGGGYTMSNSGVTKLDTKKLFGDFEWNTRQLNMSRLGEILLEEASPPIQAVVVYNCNPVVTAPDQNRVVDGFCRDDLFTVVIEQVMTDTANYADIVLPATTFLEHWDVKKAYGSYIVGGTKPVIERCGEARPNVEIFSALGRAMGWNDQAFQMEEEDLAAAIVDNLTIPQGRVDPQRIQGGNMHLLTFGDHRGPVQFETVVPGTQDGLVDLCPDVLGNEPYKFIEMKSGNYPLRLISPANTKMISSTMGEYNYAKLVLRMNVADASQRNLNDGQEVRIYNQLGEVVCHMRIDNDVRPGVVVMPKGAWRKSSRNGKTSTALCPSHTNIVGGGACFNDALVEVARVAQDVQA